MSVYIFYTLFLISNHIQKLFCLLFSFRSTLLKDLAFLCFNYVFIFIFLLTYKKINVIIVYLYHLTIDIVFLYVFFIIFNFIFQQVHLLIFFQSHYILISFHSDFLYFFLLFLFFFFLTSWIVYCLGNFFNKNKISASFKFYSPLLLVSF